MIISNSGKDLLLQAIADSINSGNASGVDIMIGAEVAASFDFTNPAEADISDGILTFAPIADVLATKSGAPTLAIIKNGSGDSIFTLSIGSEVVLNSDILYKGGYVSLTGLRISI